MEEPKEMIAGERPPAQAGTRADESADSSPCGAGKQAHVMEVAWHPAPYNTHTHTHTHTHTCIV